MMRSLYSGITGLRNHQTRMDVIGNNIANVNTVGYKYSRTVFQDLYSQTLAAGSRNSYDAVTGVGLGGTNSKQVGLGVTLSAIDIMFTPGADQYTGYWLDVKINDDGFFCIGNNGQETYTRGGNFYMDNDNYIVTASGSFVKGYGFTEVGGKPQPNLADEKPAIQIDPTYTNCSIATDGLISAYDPATEKIVNIGYLKMATFPNTNGLEKIGGNYYRETVSSGKPIATTPGRDGCGTVSSGSLEMSNVDLSNEFVDLIVTQRGFQANSRTITVSDQMLEELVNLKR